MATTEQPDAIQAAENNKDKLDSPKEKFANQDSEHEPLIGDGKECPQQPTTRSKVSVQYSFVGNFTVFNFLAKCLPYFR